MKQVALKSTTHLCQGCIFDKQVNGGMPRCVAPAKEFAKCLKLTGKDRKIWIS